MAIPPGPARGRKTIRPGPGQQIVAGKDFGLADEVRYIQRHAADAESARGVSPRAPGHRRRSPAPGSHRTWRADFPHQRSSAVASQHCKRLQLPVGEAQFRCQQRCPFFDSVEGVPGEAAAGPAAAAKHPAPVTLPDPIYFDETPEFSGDAVISIGAAWDGVDFAGLFTDRVMSYTLPLLSG